MGDTLLAIGNNVWGIHYSLGNNVWGIHYLLGNNGGYTISYRE